MEPALNCSTLTLSHMDTMDERAEALGVLQGMCRLAGASEGVKISAVVTGILGSLLTCGLLLSLFFFIFTVRFRKNRIVKMSSPNLNLVILLGSILTYISAFMFSAQEQVSSIIQVRISFLYIGVSLVFGPLLGKSWRLHRVFTHRVPDKRVIIKDLTLLGLQAILVFVDSLLLLTWVLADPVLCSQDVSASIKAAERGTFCAVSRTLSCSSRHQDFWVILLVGFKGSLLVYGSYLAGLTKNISNPPVNQCLVIMVGTTLVMVATGVVLLVTRYLPAWPSLVYGVTSGSILACTVTINCLIFIPQVLQWKHFEEEVNHSNVYMAKYFNNPCKSMKSMYSEEQIYQLLGENTSMRRLLTEKNAVIDSLQEQVTNAKQKLVQLLKSECSVDTTDVTSMSSSVFSIQPTGDTMNKADNKEQGDQATIDHTNPENHLQEETTVTLAEGHSQTSSQDPQEPEGNVIQNSDKQESGNGTVSRNVSFADIDSKDKGADAQCEAWDRLATKVNYISSEKLQEILRELSAETLPGNGHSPWGLRRASHTVYRETAAYTAEGFRQVCSNLSPYNARRKRGRRYSSYNTRDKYVMRRDSHIGAIRLVKTNQEFAQPSLPPSTELNVQTEGSRVQENGGLWITKLSGQPGHPMRQSQPANWKPYGQDMLGPRDLRLESPFSDLDTSSSEETLCFCHHPYCDICSPTFESSDTESEHVDNLEGWTNHPTISRPIVNFNEDLQPTLV